MNQYTSSNPGMMSPQSDGRRIIFPLSQFKGTYTADNFISSLVDNRCSYEEINHFLNDISLTTNRMKSIRTANFLMISSLLIYLFCFIFGLMIEIQNADVDYHKEDFDNSGVFLIFFGIFILITFNIAACIHKNIQKNKLFKQVIGVLDIYKQVFLQRGLRWAVPENCNWLELWMDYIFFSPYYLQPYPSPSVPLSIPSYQLQSNNYTNNNNVSYQLSDNVDHSKTMPFLNNEEVTQSLSVLEHNQSNAINQHMNINGFNPHLGLQIPFAQGNVPIFQMQESPVCNHSSVLQSGYPNIFYQMPC